MSSQMRKSYCIIVRCLSRLDLGMADASVDTSGIARSFYPLEETISFDINPVRAAWTPLAAGEESLLNMVLLCSEVHKNYPLGKAGIDHSSPYYCHAIKNVNARLSAGEIYDAVIGAVSCLILIEVCSLTLQEILLTYSSTYMVTLMHPLCIRRECWR